MPLPGNAFWNLATSAISTSKWTLVATRYPYLLSTTPGFQAPNESSERVFAENDLNSAIDLFLRGSLFIRGSLVSPSLDEPRGILYHLVRFQLTRTTTTPDFISPKFPSIRTTISMMITPFLQRIPTGNPNPMTKLTTTIAISE
jgi:hypothetical protein